MPCPLCNDQALIPVDGHGHAFCPACTTCDDQGRVTETCGQPVTGLPKFDTGGRAEHDVCSWPVCECVVACPTRQAELAELDRPRKPPLGLMPRSRWVERRIQDLIAAITRYNNAGHLAPKDWLDELADLTIFGEDK